MITCLFKKQDKLPKDKQVYKCLDNTCRLLQDILHYLLNKIEKICIHLIVVILILSYLMNNVDIIII